MRVLNEESTLKLELEWKFLQNQDIYLKVKENVFFENQQRRDLPFKLYDKSFLSLNQYKEKNLKKNQKFLFVFHNF